MVIPRIAHNNDVIHIYKAYVTNQAWKYLIYNSLKRDRYIPQPKRKYWIHNDCPQWKKAVFSRFEVDDILVLSLNMRKTTVLSMRYTVSVRKGIPVLLCIQEIHCFVCSFKSPKSKHKHNPPSFFLPGTSGLLQGDLEGCMIPPSRLSDN